MKILHIGTDDKFLDQAMDLFEVEFPGANAVCLISPPPYRFLKTKPDMVMGAHQKIWGMRKDKLREYDLVILHSLVRPMFSTVRNAHGIVPTVWFGWGYDYYDLIAGKKLLDHKTEMLMRALEERLSFRKVMALVVNNILMPWRKKCVVEKLSFFSPVIPSEYGMVKDARVWKKFPEQVHWNYGALEDHLVKGVEGDRVFGLNVLVGNSADPNNNHYEILEIIHDEKWRKGKVVVPLSYGNVDYAKKIVEIGEDMFGEEFEGVLDFLPIAGYLEKISSCELVFMNHMRQQALGTIIIMLYLGARVFIRKDNPIYGYMKEKGVVIYCLEDYISGCGAGRVDNAAFENNRAIMMAEWGRMAALNKTRRIVQCLP